MDRPPARTLVLGLGNPLLSDDAAGLAVAAELTRLLGWHREQVDRLFRLDHASRSDQIEEAFAALNQQIDVSVHSAA
jgi:Ni,Fe-hydrogenase maturation factor